MTRTKKIQILLMTVITLGICTFIMWKTLDKEEFVMFSNDNNTTNSSNDEYVVNKETALEYIKEYNLSYVLRTNDEELTNQDKLIMAFEYLTNQESINFEEGVSKANFETYIHYVFGVEQEIENTDIKYKGATVSYNIEEELYSYIKEVKPIDNRPTLDMIIDFDKKNDEYEITIASVYIDDNNKVYSNYNDFAKKNNSILEAKSIENFENDYYGDIKEQLQKVKYTLKYEGKHLVLSSYEILNNKI